jgi:hypothetical protein
LAIAAEQFLEKRKKEEKSTGKRTFQMIKLHRFQLPQICFNFEIGLKIAALTPSATVKRTPVASAIPIPRLKIVCQHDTSLNTRKSNLLTHFLKT